MVPLAVLERVGAIPYSFDENSLRIALTDPDNVNGDRRAPPHVALPVEFAVAPLEDVMVEVRRLSRANVAFAASSTTTASRSTTSPTTSRPTTASRKGRSSGS